MTVILSPDGRCASTFIAPGDDVSKLRRCEGKFNHDGMHGSTEHGSAAWGDGAAYDHHPGEPLTIRLRVLVEGVRRLQAQVAEQAAVIADRDATIARLTAELAEGLIDHERERDNATPRSRLRMVRRMSRAWPVAVSVAMLVLIVVGCVGMLAGWVPGLGAVTP